MKCPQCQCNDISVEISSDGWYLVCNDCSWNLENLKIVNASSLWRFLSRAMGNVLQMGELLATEDDNSYMAMRWDWGPDCPNCAKAEGE